MRLLAIDTSGVALTVAAAQSDEVVTSCCEPLARGHAERVLPLLREVLERAGWAWRDAQMVAVTLGPGKFTGLRAGVSVARALSLALARPALGLGTLEVVAETTAAMVPGNDWPIQAILDAGRGQVYAQRFAADLQPLTDPAMLPLAQLLEGLPSDCLLAADALAGLGHLPNQGNRVIEARLDARYLARAAWRRLAGGAAAVPGTALRPLYLRPPDARPSAGASLLAAQG